ncbi:MAG: hypothetical protein VB013_15125, partial [Anaerolineaceae bacterium]|nr:hypothetical protein [Anaerolineaceae bacterium]
MEFQITFLENEKIIEVRLTDYLDWAVIEQIVPQVSKLALERNCRSILLNFATANLKLSTVNIYMTPDKLAKEFKKYQIDIHSLRRALIVAADEADYKFLSNVTVNQFQRLQIFHDEASA